MSELCPKCGSPTLSWFTSRDGLQAADVQQCSNCGVRVSFEDWTPPITPLSKDCCMNCSGRRQGGSCTICGLTDAEDRQVHEELRALVDSSSTFMLTARKANHSGRRLLALKLATAGSKLVGNHNTAAEEALAARALRVWLLGIIGFREAALSDAKAWLGDFQQPPSIAWATFGQQLEQASRQPEALDAYQRALNTDPFHIGLHARRAKIMLAMRQLEQAGQEILTLYRHPTPKQNARVAGMDVAWGICDAFLRAGKMDEVQQIVDAVTPEIEQHPGLIAHKAYLLATSGETKAAKKELKKARKLNQSLPLYELVERALKNTGRSAWWRW